MLPSGSLSVAAARGAPAAAPAAGWWALSGLCLAALVGFLGQFALNPFLPAIAADLQVGVALLGQIPALMMLLAAVLGLAAGPLADHYGHRRALLAGLLAVGASAVATAAAQSFAVFVLVAVFGAIGRAVVQPVLLAIAGTRFAGGARRRAISWTLAAISGSVIVGLPILTAVAARAGWRAAFLVLAAGCAAVVLFVRRVLASDGPRPAGRAHLGLLGTAYAPLLRHRPTLGLIAGSLLRNVYTWMLHTYLGAFLVHRFGLDTQQVGWVYVVVGLGFFAGSLAAGGALGDLPPWAALALGSVFTAAVHAAVLLVPADPSTLSTTLSSTPSPVLPTAGTLAPPAGTTAWLGPAVVAALTATSAVVLGFANALNASLLVSISPAGRAATLTLNQSSFSIGSAAGSSLGGLLLSLGGYDALALGMPLFGVAAALAVWLPARRNEE